MPQARDEAGNIWETDAQGNAVRLLQPAAPSAPMPTVIPLPETPKDRFDRDIRSRGDARDQTRTDLAAEGQQRNNNNSSFDQKNKLAERYGGEQSIKEYRIAVQELARALGTGDGPQGDLALTYAFAKAMDPGSVVRDTEQTMQTESQPWFQSKVEQIKKQFGADGAGSFTPEARAQLRQQVINGVAQRAKLYDSRRNYYSEIAKRNGFDPYEIIGESDAKPFVQDFQRYDQRQRQESGPMGGGASPGLAGGGDTRKSIPIPPDMQAEYARFFGSGGPIDPQGYAQLRTGLNQKYGFPAGDPAEYAKEAEGLNAARAQGRNFVPQIPPVDAAMTGRDQFNASVFNDNLTGGVAGAALMGAGSMGGAADEVWGGLNSLATGRDASSEIARMDATRQAAASAHPVANTLGQIGGAGLTAYGGLAALPASMGLPGIIGTGAAYGAASGAAENNDNRLAGAVMGAGIGAAGGAVGAKLIAPVAERIGRTAPFQKAAEVLANRTGRAFNPAPQLTPLDAATSAVKPDLTQIVQNLRDARRLNLPYALADAAPELRNLSGTVARKSPEARALAETTFDPRARGQADRAVNAIDQNLAPITDLRQRATDIIAGGKPVYSPLYERAYASPTISSPALDDVLRTPAGRGATARANTIAANEMRDPQAMGFSVDGAGNTVLNPPPVAEMERFQAAREGWDAAKAAYDNALASQRASLTPGSFSSAVKDAERNLQKAGDELTGSKSGLLTTPRGGSIAETKGYTTQSLDYVKRGLDDILETNRNPVTGKLQLDENGRAVNGVRSKLLNALDALNPDYKHARGAYERFAKQAGALDRGKGMTSTMLPQRDFNTLLDNAQSYDAALPGGWEGTATVPEMRRGFATSMADQVDKMRLSSNPYDAIYGSPLQQKKVEALFPEGAGDFRRNYDLEGDMGKTRLETLGGSQTAVRQAADEAIGGQLGTMAIDAASQAATGGGLGVGTAIQAARRILADSAKLGIGKQAQKRATEIAPVLFDTSNPAAIADMVDAMAEKLGAVSARRGQYGRRYGLFGSAGAVNALSPGGN